MWQAQALAVFAAALQINQMTGRLLAERVAVAETPAQSARQMRMALARLDETLRSFEWQ